jgi:hypothetical protein
MGTLSKVAAVEFELFEAVDEQGSAQGTLHN